MLGIIMADYDQMRTSLKKPVTLSDVASMLANLIRMEQPLMARDVIVVELVGGLDNMLAVTAGVRRPGRRIIRLQYLIDDVMAATRMHANDRVEFLRPLITEGQILRARMRYARDHGRTG